MRQPASADQPWNAVRLAATAYALVVVRADPAELQGEAPRSRAARESEPDDARRGSCTAQWRRLLTGRIRRSARSGACGNACPPRRAAEVCAFTLHGVGGAVARLFWHRPIRDNPLLLQSVLRTPVGARRRADVEITFVFPDVRGSTRPRGTNIRIRLPGSDAVLLRSLPLRSTTTAGSSTSSLATASWRYSSLSSPARTTPAGRSTPAGQFSMLSSVDGLARKGLMVGAGVHTGDAFVGVIGGDEKVDSPPSATQSTSRLDSVPWPARASCLSAASPGIEPASALHPRSVRSRSPDGRATSQS